MKKITSKSMKRLQKKIDYEFEDESLLETSLTHKSFANEAERALIDNERLEFLGDSVLNLIMSELLMDYFPSMDEGVLSKKRSSLVSEKSLAKIARKIELGDYLRLGKGEEITKGRQKNSILSDTLEALIGAIYVDGKLDNAKNFVLRYFKNAIRYSGKPGSYKDYKTICQELSQKIFKRPPEYRVVKVSGPDHDRIFESEFVVGSKSFGRGKGRSKKDSQQKCARAALKKLQELA